MFLNYIKRSFITIDNAGKIFPAVSNDARSSTFRLSMYINENIDKELLEKLKEAGIEAAPFTYDETIQIADSRNLASKASPHKINENEGIIVDKIQESAPPPKIDLDVSDRIQDDIGEIDVGTIDDTKIQEAQNREVQIDGGTNEKDEEEKDEGR